MERRRRPVASLATRLPVVVLPLLAALPSPGPVAAQLATVTVEENLRLEPNGVVLARVLPGTAMPLEARDGRWLEVTLEGWIWSRSLQVTDRAGFDLVVSAEEGENLRGQPQGAVLARLASGTLLEELERTPGWIRARRTGWIWSESVRLDETGPGDAGSGDAPSAEPSARGARAGGEEPGPDAAVAGAGAGAPGAGVLTARPGGAPILSAPDGDTLGGARAGADVQVLERRGGWARVRLEGWTWAPPGSDAAGEAAGGSVPSGGGEAASAGPADVRAEPERWQGRVVTWDLQFVSLERAERVRTDFFENEPFLLTRVPGGRGPFVYVAVPPDRLAEMEGLTPLERLRITGRVRVGRSALTGSPILDLLEIRRTGR